MPVLVPRLLVIFVLSVFYTYSSVSTPYAKAAMIYWTCCLRNDFRLLEHQSVSCGVCLRNIWDCLSTVKRPTSYFLLQQYNRAVLHPPPEHLVYHYRLLPRDGGCRTPTCQATSRPRAYVSVFQRTYHHMQTSPMISLFRCLGAPSPSPHKLPFNQATLINHQVPPLLSPTLPPLFDAVADGQIYLLFIPGGVNFPLDGIRYMEHEQRYAIPLPAGRVRD